MKKSRALLLSLPLALLPLAACDSVNDHNGVGDSPVGQRYDDSWDVTFAPDGFPNVASQCSPFVPHERVYVVTHSHTDVAPVIVSDERCP